MDHVRRIETLNEMLAEFNLPGNEEFCGHHVQLGSLCVLLILSVVLMYEKSFQVHYRIAHNFPVPTFA